MAPPKKRALPKPLPEGFILTDTDKKEWRLGKIIGQGGFGLIYLASHSVDRPVAGDTDFVIKLEYHENGPLFSELKFYQRAAKAESMEKWKSRRKLDFLGIPTYWGSGLAEYNDLRYRFMVMDRLGSDLQKICAHKGGRMKKATVLQLGQTLVSVLEYIHENEYVHADIKAANLMLGYRNSEQVYLADYGLSYRYCPDGVHKEYKENPKKGHNGTIEYTSLDAHKGCAPSRRGDLQILGFCLLHWLCGFLPWDNVNNNPPQVQEAKARLMDNLPDSVQQLSVSGASTDEVAAFLLYVKTLGYQDKPDYQRLKAVLATSVMGRLDFSAPQGPTGVSTTKVQDQPTREKKAGRARGAGKAKAVPAEVDDEEEEEMKKPKAVAAHYRRVPPLTKPQSQQEPAATRSLRPRREPVMYNEDDSDDDEEEEEEEDPWQDEEYFGSYGTLRLHLEMLSDKSRTEAYRQVILSNSASLRNKVVMDLGCGTGIISLFCAQLAQPSVVYAVEASSMSEYTRQLVKQNGCEEVITVLQGRAEELELPERVDILVSEWMGNCLLFEFMVESVLLARDRWLREGGVMWPSSAALTLVPCQAHSYYAEKMAFWERPYGLDFTPLQPLAQQEFFTKPKFSHLIEPDDCLAAPCNVICLDMYTLQVKDLEEIKAQFHFCVEKSGVFHGFTAWFTVHFESLETGGAAVELNTGPNSEPTHWKQTLFMLDRPVSVYAGDSIRGNIVLRRNPVWRRHMTVTMHWNINSSTEDTDNCQVGTKTFPMWR